MTHPPIDQSDSSESDDFRSKLEQRVLYSHVREEEHGIVLLDYLEGKFHRFDANGWRDAILQGRVTVNNRPADAEQRLKRHDLAAYYPPDEPEPDANLAYRVVYEDADLLVIDKPGNLCVHPTGPFFRHTLWHLAGLDYGELRFVNRLDRETSGLLAAARNPRTAAALDNHQCPFHKEYLALVFGSFPETPVRARGRLVHDTNSVVAKKKRFVFETELSPGGENAGETSDTELALVSRIPPDLSLVRAILHTGRQHQVRATLQSMGFPLVGDKLYGPDERLFLKIRDQSFTDADRALLRLPRQALHSAVLEFPHPATGRLIRCESEFPADLLKND